ncbi:hypothetical protein [Stenotrophomonas acidaminiphila]
MSNIIDFKTRSKKVKQRKEYRRRAKPPKVSRHFRFDQETLAALEGLAQASGMNLTEYIRELTKMAVDQQWQLEKYA